MVPYLHYTLSLLYEEEAVVHITLPDDEFFRRIQLRVQIPRYHINYLQILLLSFQDLNPQLLVPA